MDRAFVLDNERIDAIDVDSTNLFAMIGLGKLTSAIIGSGPFFNELTCVPTGPASLSVVLNPGEIYSLQAIDATTYGPIPADAREIVKQGILMDAATIPLTAPATPGQSIDYLIQVIYQDADSDPENRPFFGGSPTVVDTTRRGNLVYNVKAGIPATTGTQVPPTPDAGYTGAWVVTVANGQTQINSGDIAAYDIANFIIGKLQDKLTEAEADARYPLSTSFANSITANGYQKFPGGLIMQWGTVSIPYTSPDEQVSAAATFPIPFPTALFSLTSTCNTIGASGTCPTATFTNQTLSGFTSWLSSNDPFGSSGNFINNWIAIGH